MVKVEISSSSARLGSETNVELLARDDIFNRAPRVLEDHGRFFDKERYELRKHVDCRRALG